MAGRGVRASVLRVWLVLASGKIGSLAMGPVGAILCGQAEIGA